MLGLGGGSVLPPSGTRYEPFPSRPEHDDGFGMSSRARVRSTTIYYIELRYKYPLPLT